MKSIPLREKHEALGASFTDFGGWEMPVRYSSDLAEHHAVRESAGLFDISHMGELFVEGKESAAFLDFALVGAASEIAIGRAKYSLICNAAGGIIDDLIVYRLGDNAYLIVANASNREAVAASLNERAAGFAVETKDETDSWALLAIQGPKSVEILSSVTNAPLGDLKYYAISEAEISGAKCLLARTGYTGEDGFEIYIPVESAGSVLDALFLAGKDLGLLPAGLACRDTLRLEAGMPLYGHEMNLDVNPYQAGFGKVVRLDKPVDFVGKAALSKLSEVAPEKVLVGLAGEGKRAARADYEVFVEGSDSAIGVVTSGALSPTLGFPVAMAYVDADFAQIGSSVSVDIRGSRTPFKVVKLPFYKRQN
ncbi:MAG: glycine cleavage system aminomethyltransferase GcvT [Actinobacteria bacterium]|nr:glycine cleavage system aminomethyltransferase GcvT [Actinomycetota bacterium]